jgi:hypothetical protein
MYVCARARACACASGRGAYAAVGGRLRHGRVDRDLRRRQAPVHLCVCVCVCACVRACVRACARARAHTRSAHARAREREVPHTLWSRLHTYCTCAVVYRRLHNVHYCTRAPRAFSGRVTRKNTPMFAHERKVRTMAADIIYMYIYVYVYIYIYKARRLRTD